MPNINRPRSSAYSQAVGDSLTACHLASTYAPQFDGCAFINTGTGVDETRDYVIATCSQFNWLLRELHPPVSFEEIVLRWGFPGPAGHTVIYNRLKERPLRVLVRDNKPSTCQLCGWPRKNHGSPSNLKFPCGHSFVHQNVMLVTGVRKQESDRRMGHIVAMQKEGCRIWVAPLVNWDQTDRYHYITQNNLPNNPVTDILCRSGECNCGCYAKPGEMAELEQYYPKTALYLHGLEAKAKEAGVHCVWGTRPPKEGVKKVNENSVMGLCWSCNAKQMKEEDKEAQQQGK
jgi:3'-phosphoadenosine 5'-phosphosulfate sulfotransferase (PAPS reductase)/FAD synthetase